jgi:drug/metabolite transporter (DMT)-like permease
LTPARLRILAAATLFSTGGAAIKIAAFTAPQVSALRSGIAAVTLLLWLRGRLNWSGAAILIGVVYAATLTLFVGATKLTTAANAIFLQSTAPLYLLLLAPLVLRERVHRRDALYLLAVAAGLLLCFFGERIATATAPDPRAGNLLGLACGVAWALTLLGLRWAERGHARPGVGLTAVVTGNAIAFLVALPYAWPFPRAGAAEWSTVVYLGVFQIGLAYIFVTSAMGDLPALEASLLLLLEPVLNPVWAWTIRGEEPGVWTFLGGVVIIAATAIKSLSDARIPARARGAIGTRE